MLAVWRRGSVRTIWETLREIAGNNSSGLKAFISTELQQFVDIPFIHLISGNFHWSIMKKKNIELFRI